MTLLLLPDFHPLLENLKQNTYITGPAGSGKTYNTALALLTLAERDKLTACVASPFDLHLPKLKNLLYFIGAGTSPGGWNWNDTGGVFSSNGSTIYFHSPLGLNPDLLWIDNFEWFCGPMPLGRILWFSLEPKILSQAITPKGFHSLALTSNSNPLSFEPLDPSPYLTRSYPGALWHPNQITEGHYDEGLSLSCSFASNRTHTAAWFYHRPNHGPYFLRGFTYSKGDFPYSYPPDLLLSNTAPEAHFSPPENLKSHIFHPTGCAAGIKLITLFGGKYLPFAVNEAAGLAANALPGER